MYEAKFVVLRQGAKEPLASRAMASASKPATNIEEILESPGPALKPTLKGSIRDL